MFFGDRLTTFDRASQLDRAELARRWADLPAAMPRDHARYLLEGPGLSVELEALALSAALAAAATTSVAEMIHRAAFIGAELDQLAAAVSTYPEGLWGLWERWARDERDNGRMPAEEYTFVSERLSGRERDEHFLLKRIRESNEETG